MRIWILLVSICLNYSIFASGIEQADVYNKNSDLQWQWAISSLEKCTWQGNERILDVGCGDGKITSMLCEKVPDGYVVGLDVSNKMIKFASSTFSSKKYRNLLFLEGTATQLPFHEQFDFLISFCALHWVLDQKLALENIKESLVKGGKALLVIPGSAPNNISTQCENLVKTQKWRSLFPNFKPQRVYFTKEEYASLLKDVGLSPISIETTQSETIYHAKIDLINWLKPLVNFISHLSKEQQADFLNDLANQMLVVDPIKDNVIKIHHIKLEVVAKKEK